jgi:predicted RNase H-like HicB family nuclease
MAHPKNAGMELIQFTMAVQIQIFPEDDHFVADCAAFDLVTQGDSKNEARDNIVEALHLFVESCYQRGALEKVLRQCGFEATRNPPLIEEGIETVNVPLSLVAAKHAENRTS